MGPFSPENCRFLWGSGLPCNNGFLEPRWFVEPFWQSSLLWQTDWQTMILLSIYTCNSRLHVAYVHSAGSNCNSETVFRRTPISSLWTVQPAHRALAVSWLPMLSLVNRSCIDCNRLHLIHTETNDIAHIPLWLVQSKPYIIISKLPALHAMSIKCHHHHFICNEIQQHRHVYMQQRAGQQGPIRTLTAARKNVQRYN